MTISIDAHSIHAGGFLQALHDCAIKDGKMADVIDVLGIGPAMGCNADGDELRFELLARAALYNFVSGMTGHLPAAKESSLLRENRRRTLDPSEPLSHRMVLAMVAWLNASGVPCIVHTRPDKFRRVPGALNLWRKVCTQSPPSTPATVSSSPSSSDDDECGKHSNYELCKRDPNENWANGKYGMLPWNDTYGSTSWNDTYGGMPWNDDGLDDDDTALRVSKMAATMVVRLPRALLSPFANAVINELDTLCIEFDKVRLAEVIRRTETANKEIASLQDVASRLDESAQSIRSSNLSRLKAIKQLKTTQECLDADIKRMHSKSADAYSKLLTMRESAAKAATELKHDMTLMRAESIALETEAAAVVARKESSTAALRVACADLETCEGELRRAKDTAEGQVYVLRATLQELALDKAATEMDIKTTNDYMAIVVVEAANARMAHRDALEESASLRDAVASVQKEADSLRFEATSLQDEITCIKDALDASRNQLACLQKENSMAGEHIERLQRERQMQTALCKRVTREVAELTERHIASVRTCQNAKSACRYSMAQANAALQEIALLESKTAMHLRRASHARDAVIEAESAAFKAQIK